MLYVIVGLVIAAVTLVLSALRQHYTYWTRRGIPQETPHYLLGNVHGAAAGRVELRSFNQRLYEQYKREHPFVGMYIFLTRAALILNLNLIRDIFIRDFGNFQDRGMFSNARDDPLTAHLFRLEGEQWRAMRHKLTPVFSASKMQFMFPTVVAVGKELAKACAEAMRASTNNVVELKELSVRYTTDVIGNCAFGIECNSLADPDAQFRRHGREIFEHPRHSQLMQAFMLMHPEWAQRLHMKMFPDHIIDFYTDMVRRTVHHRQQHDIKRNDFMDLLIAMKAEDEQLALKSGPNDLSQGLTLQQMVAQAFVFFVAGFDTSSTTMAVCLYELALNPAVQEKARAEIMRVLHAHNDELNYDAMHEMTYLEQVVAETLRKYPVVPYLVRKAKADYAVPNTQHIIEKGRLVVIPVHAIHHDAEIYAEPERFDPDRFLPEAIQQRHSSAYLPFGEGPRNCIGMRFGKMQTKIGLIDLLRNYRFSKSEQTQVPLEFNERIFQITPANGIYLRVDWVDQ